MGDVSGQQPKPSKEPPPAPLLPAEQAWLRDLPAIPAAGGALDADRVYIPLQDDKTLALVRETGEDAWTNPIGTPWPLLLAKRFVIAVTTDEVVAMDRATGETAWRRDLPARSIAPSAVGGDRLLVALGNGSLIALRTADGSIAWSSPIDGLAAPVSLATDASAVYLTMDHSQVVAIALESGQGLWRTTLDGILSPPAPGKDRVFVGTTTNTFYALNARTGKVEWTWPPGRIGGDVIGATVDGDVTYFVGLDNLLRAVNRGNGNQLWKQSTPARPLAAPQAFGGIVAVFGVAPAIATFNAKTHAAIETYVIPTASGATTAPSPMGVPLIDPDLRPFRVAAVVITTDGRAIGLRPTGMMFRESALTPLTELPGRALQRDRLPTHP